MPKIPTSARPPAAALRELKKVKNARDLAESFPLIKPGLIFRSGSPGKALPEDIAVLRDELKISEYLDLRSSNELVNDTAWVGLTGRGLQVGPAVGPAGTDPSTPATEPPSRAGASHHHVALLEGGTFGVGLATKLPLWKGALAAAYYVTGAHERLRDLVVPIVNARGLPLVYEVLLDRCGPLFLRVLETISDAATSGRPSLLFCRLGKDRTGVSAALVLTALGAPDDIIVADYARSGDAHAIALGGLESMPDLRGLDIATFEASPPQAMRDLLAYAERRYGGLAGYLERIGFGPDKRARLRDALLTPPAASL